MKTENHVLALNYFVKTIAPKTLIGWIAFFVFIWAQSTMISDAINNIKYFIKTYHWDITAVVDCMKEMGLS